MYISKYLSTYTLIFSVPLGTLLAQTPASSELEPVTFATALHRAIDNDPRLNLNSAVAEAAEGQIDQADLPPNPIIGFEAENFLGTGPITGVQGLELTLGISQVIETADKQQLRTALARKERTLVDWQREVLLTELETNVRAAFVDVLLAQNFVALRNEQLALAQESEDETTRLVEAARSPQVELTRATLAVRQQQFALDRARRDLATAKTMLAALWGTESEQPYTVEGKVVLDSDLPGFTELASRLPSTAQLAQYEVVLQSREAALELEKARAVPDVEVFGGARYYNEDMGNYGFVAGVNIPWPLFDRNQGNIRTARAQVRATEYEREAVRREMLIQLNRAYQALASAHEEVISVQKDLLPSAEQTLIDTNAGYERGQFTQLAVLESREALFEVREAYLDALQRYATAQAAIEALTRPANLTQ